VIVVCDSTILTKKLGLIDQIQPLVGELKFRISEEPRASARGFFQRKSQYDLKATSVQNYTANGRRWSAIPPLPLGWAPALPNGASWLFHVNDHNEYKGGKQCFDPVS